MSTSDGGEAPAGEGAPAAPRANSRDSTAGAGWCCPPSPELREGSDRRPFSWIDPRPLIASRNDKLARWRVFGADPTNDARRSWMAALGDRELRVDRTDLDRPSFVLVGDTGEGDMSQLVTIPLLDRLSHRTDFMMIASDVIYPAGGAATYLENFYDVYKGYKQPIYAVPGNHDWYDGLTGFMFNLCGVETPPPAPAVPLFSRARVRELLSARPKQLTARQLHDLRDWKARRPATHQPGPYFVLDTGPLQLVGIDTGITGEIDRDQARWLREVSAASRKPKILVTGKPLYVDGQRDTGAIEGEPGRCVDEIVSNPDHNYVAAVGGDIHNYQRYPVRVGRRVIQYLVSGGGGAFMHATHTIPKIALDGMSEADFRCYPLRGDSLSLYSRLYAQRIPPYDERLHIHPAQAAAYMAERLKMESSKVDAQDVAVTDRTRRAAERIFPPPGQGRPLPGQRTRGLLQPLISEFFDWNEPPLFKHVLHVEASASELRIRCLAATGCAGREEGVLEDELVARPDADGVWQWAVVGP